MKQERKEGCPGAYGLPEYDHMDCGSHTCESCWKQALKGERTMYGIIQGLSDTDEIKYCPRCGYEVSEYYADGTAMCRGCNYRFGVVEMDEEEQGE